MGSGSSGRMCLPEPCSARSRALSQILTARLALEPRVREIPCGIPCRARGTDVLERAGRALGITWGLPTVLGCILYFCQVWGRSQHTPNPRSKGEGIKRGRTGKTARQRRGLLHLLSIRPSPALGRPEQPPALGEGAAGARIACARAGSWECVIVCGQRSDNERCCR